MSSDWADGQVRPGRKVEGEYGAVRKGRHNPTFDGSRGRTIVPVSGRVIVTETGEVVDYVGLDEERRHELERVAAMSVAMCSNRTGDVGPVIVRETSSDAGPMPKYRMALTFDGGTAFAAFVDERVSREAFVAVGSDYLERWEKLEASAPEPREVGG